MDGNSSIRRIGYVASEIVSHRGVVIRAAMSLYRATRNDLRNMVGHDRFVEVFMDTPIDVNEARDSNGLLAKARRGEIQGLPAINDPYNPPERPEIVLGTVNYSAEEDAKLILDHLRDQGFVR